MSDCPFYEPVHLPPDYEDTASAKCRASGNERQEVPGCPSGHKDECYRYHRFCADAAEGELRARTGWRWWK